MLTTTKRVDGSYAAMEDENCLAVFHDEADCQHFLSEYEEAKKRPPVAIEEVLTGLAFEKTTIKQPVPFFSLLYCFQQDENGQKVYHVSDGKKSLYTTISLDAANTFQHDLHNGVLRAPRKDEYEALPYTPNWWESTPIITLINENRDSSAEKTTGGDEPQ